LIKVKKTWKIKKNCNHSIKTTPKFEINPNIIFAPLGLIVMHIAGGARTNLKVGKWKGGHPARRVGTFFASLCWSSY